MKRKDFFKLIGLGAAGIMVTQITKSQYKTIELKEKPSGRQTFGLVDRWISVKGNYPLKSVGTSMPVFCGKDTIRYTSDYGITLKAAIIVNGNGDEVACYWGELGEEKTRELLKDVYKRKL